MALIQIRFNTKYLEGSRPELKWRVLVDGEEFLARHVHMKVASTTTEDVISTGETKWHITCQGRIEWKGDDAYILSELL